MLAKNYLPGPGSYDPEKATSIREPEEVLAMGKRLGGVSIGRD